MQFVQPLKSTANPTHGQTAPARALLWLCGAVVRCYGAGAGHPNGWLHRVAIRRNAATQRHGCTHRVTRPPVATP